ncbi:sugar O-acyltransferase (sialic acid O-acetyltransferase NeuD family) [Algoriphagus iocasae]|jgi:sugar O-acyltransferase (sialic acid O-acetyltransferase NeuD family)|uniref:Sugar O-acyltransferase (Sialic acid O-acetyltransferase NeuD family) n=1 Tax=Algoriphagus iocasae TaxID=1836499 RepID=A0A841MN17_9BACT|nr:acetyltransferase [Algoriphagus iocasae]MBB6326907.1 sugar O-acyltransferase (sialic acid O-acetyltransferase NeuD family) [Algoriphagus iocasae]
MEKPVIIFGAKGIAHPALEIFNSNEVMVYGFLEEDESMHGTEINTVSVLGNPEDDGFLKLIGQKAEAFVAVDDMKYRKFLVELLNERRKVQPINAIHNTAYISTDAVIGHGNFINAKVTIGTAAEIGQHCILHTGAIVDHKAKLGDFVQIGAGSIINAEVTVEEGAFIGSGVTVVSGVTIGKNARVGAGSVVISSVGANETVFGNPAAKIK